ncbi:DMT family transporter [Roseovarius phycicola]|uniref:DMT family transporter n=1 Tax=Roseovarius phycicola TaxID=3080976 RepID=A0ABZ2HC95_9RHOB
MIRHVSSALVLSGVGLTALYSLLITGADAITKGFAQSYSAPQLFAISGGLVALFSLLANRDTCGQRRCMSTQCPRAMTVRVVATVLGTLAFFHAFRLLPFADVFLFIALIPLFTAILSGPVLGEPVRSQTWMALGLGVVGVACVFPEGVHGMGLGHLIALSAVILGSISMVTSRFIGRRDTNLLAQVFYPNLALMGVMALALPFVFKPMSSIDVALAAIYALLLFGARWVLVAALRILPAYVVTPLMNLQFIWMVAIGWAFFAETPAAHTYLGAFIIISAGGWLIWERIRPVADKTLVPAE